MELGVREWAYIIGALVLLAVLLDAWRRRSSQHKTEIRVARKARFASAPDDDNEPLNPELPGGVRVVEVRDEPREQPLKPPPVSAHSVAVPRGTGVPATAPRKQAQPEVAEDLPEAAAGDLKAEAAERTPEPQLEENEAGGEDLQPTMKGFSATLDDAILPHDIEPEEAPRKAVKSRAKKKIAAPEPPVPEPAVVQQAAEPVEQDLGEPLELIVLNVMAAPGAKFGGREMLEILLACDLRLGSMNIFHRFEKAGGKGREQFSVINSVEPGVFDLDNIDAFETPGVGFFMRLPGPDDPMEAFECMLETARCLVKNLDGQLLDDRHSAATGQTVEHYRQRIRDFERKQLTLV